MLIVPALGRWREEDQGFKVVLGYVVSSRSALVTCVKGTKMGKQTNN